MLRLFHLHRHHVPSHRPRRHRGFTAELQALLIKANSTVNNSTHTRKPLNARRPAMGIFKSIKKWFLGLGISIARSKAKSSLATNQPVKDALHLVNQSIQSRFVVEGDGKQKALQYAKDLMMLAHAYADAYGDKDSPTCISEQERAHLDAMWDAIIDRYVPQERLSEWIDYAFDYADNLVKKSV